jgi:hypothetical protein
MNRPADLTLLIATSTADARKKRWPSGRRGK